VATWTRVKNTSVYMDTCINTHGHMDTCIYTRVQSDACVYYTQPYGRVDLLHAAIWPRVKYTRGHLFSTYCQPRGHKDTRLYGRVATVIATVDMRRIEAFFL